MRLDARRLATFLRDPGKCRAVLLYGEDAGLIRSRADLLVAAVAGAADDPFRVTEIGRPTPSELMGAASALPLTGGRAVVRVREVTDAATEAVRAIMTGPSAGFVVLEGMGLPARSKLRAALESAELGAAIACYPLEGRDLARAAQELAAERGMAIDAETIQWLSGGETDYGQLRQNIEKLALYKDLKGAIDLSGAQDCFTGGSNPSMDDALFAATEGDVAACDRALALALEGGQAAASAMRAAILHIQRLLRARRSIDAGLSPEQALARLRPPLFWRRQQAFGRALALWQAPVLAGLLTALQDGERWCKHTGIPAEAVCAEALLGIAMEAASERGRAAVSRF